jgi:hypothetical protein
VSGYRLRGWWDGNFDIVNDKVVFRNKSSSIVGLVLNYPLCENSITHHLLPWFRSCGLLDELSYHSAMGIAQHYQQSRVALAKQYEPDFNGLLAGTIIEDGRELFPAPVTSAISSTETSKKKRRKPRQKKPKVAKITPAPIPAVKITSLPSLDHKAAVLEKKREMEVCRQEMSEIERQMTAIKKRMAADTLLMLAEEETVKTAKDEPNAAHEESSDQHASERVMSPPPLSNQQEQDTTSEGTTVFLSPPSDHEEHDFASERAVFLSAPLSNHEEQDSTVEHAALPLLPSAKDEYEAISMPYSVPVHSPYEILQAYDPVSDKNAAQQAPQEPSNEGYESSHDWQTGKEWGQVHKAQRTTKRNVLREAIQHTPTPLPDAISGSSLAQPRPRYNKIMIARRDSVRDLDESTRPADLPVSPKVNTPRVRSGLKLVCMPSAHNAIQAQPQPSS